ncbi:MAG: family 78 glycoside hydrolase catalytic domain [Clostridia bacterium]|nr:family 78 glycoside hydrolase catalytic domain [Clostridia bacterium]
MILYDLTVNGVNTTLTAPVSGLRFGWKMRSEKSDTFQISYRIIVALNGSAVYDSGTVLSPESVDIRAEGLVLDPETEYCCKVEVEDNHGETASAALPFATGLSADGWCGAKWIRPKKHISGWSPYLRTKFIIPEKPVAQAILYGCGLGCGEFYINGQRTDDNYIDPPATNYERTVLYRGTDVTGLLTSGGNALAVWLGEGFYSQSRVWGSTGFVYGKECAIAVLRIRFTDGTTQTVVTNTENWKYKYSPISANNVYAGEVYDCRLETPDFGMYASSEEDWESVVEDETPKGTLTGCLMPPVKIIREIPAISVKCASGASDGAWIFDLGENFAGIYELRIPAHSPRGAVYVIRTSEALNEGGALDHRSTGAFATQCIQQEIYIARGDAETEIYRPRFTYHGFRYVEITGIHDLSRGYGTMPVADMIKGLALSTDLKRISSFDSGNADLNKLHGIMDNTFRSNYHGYPEDCPAREKCGWLGDAEVVSNWALLNYGMTAAYEKYVNDIRTTTEVYGTWQMISPGKRGCGEASPLWGCAQIIIPYYMWQYTGNRSVITDNIDMMRRWVDHETNRANDCIISEGLGDWDPAGGNNNPRRMPVSHSSTFMYYEICLRMSEISKAFGFGDEQKYLGMCAEIKDALNRHFYDRERHTYGYWGSDGVALLLGTYPEGEYASLLQNTVQTIRDEKFEMPTGIYGNKYLVPALMKAGYGDAALSFLFNRFSPSFGTMMDAGGTSMWEEPDMHFVEKDTTKGVASYNHPMHGGFMYSYITCLAGIEPLVPGFRRFRIKPCRLDGVPSIDVSYDSPYGTIKVEYHKPIDSVKYCCTVTVPSNTQAVFEWSGQEPQILGSGTWVFDDLS